MFTNKFIQTLCLLFLGTLLSCGGSEANEDKTIAETEAVAPSASSQDTAVLGDNATTDTDHSQPNTEGKYPAKTPTQSANAQKPTNTATTTTAKNTTTTSTSEAKTTGTGTTTTRGGTPTKPKTDTIKPKVIPIKPPKDTIKRKVVKQEPPKESDLQKWAKALSLEWKKVLKLEDSFTDKDIEHSLAIHVLEIDGKEAASWSKLCTFSNEREVWKKLTQLEHIQFKNCRIDRGFDVLSGKKVKYMDFDKCNFLANNWESLGDIKTLENLSFENGAEGMNFSRWEWQNIFKFPNLHSLHFESVPQNQQNIKSLQTFAKNRKNLGILYNDKHLPQEQPKQPIETAPSSLTPPAWRETLLKNGYLESQVPTISKLTITKNEYRQIVASSSKAINMTWQKMTNLKTLTFKNCEMEATFLSNQDFSKMSNLTIAFESCGFTKIQDAQWTEFARKNPNVKKITLVNGDLSLSARQAIRNGNPNCNVQ